jgi:hypothetical protein
MPAWSPTKPLPPTGWSHQLHLALAESDLSIVGAALEAFRAGDMERVARSTPGCAARARPAN